MLYEAINQSVLLGVTKTAQGVLDIGCGSAPLGRKVKGLPADRNLIVALENGCYWK